MSSLSLWGGNLKELLPGFFDWINYHIQELEFS